MSSSLVSSESECRRMRYFGCFSAKYRSALLLNSVRYKTSVRRRALMKWTISRWRLTFLYPEAKMRRFRVLALHFIMHQPNFLMQKRWHQLRGLKGLTSFTLSIVSLVSCSNLLSSNSFYSSFMIPSFISIYRYSEALALFWVESSLVPAPTPHIPTCCDGKR